MKKSLLALAVLGAFASVASAQSSVTLSGAVDAGIVRAGTATGYDWSLSPSTSSRSAFTISGREDLGGGMSAFFALNHRFRIQNGLTRGSTSGGAGAADATEQAATFWRQTEVGLAGAFGDIRMGRITMPLQDMDGGFTAWGVATVADIHTGGINATVRANQAIYYRSPNMGGLSVHAAIAAADAQLLNEIGNGTSRPGITYPASPAAKLGSQRPVGFNVRYAAGPLNVGIAYDRNATDQKTVGLYGAYDFGVVRILGQYENGDNCTGTATACVTNGVRAANGVITTQGKDDVKAYSISASVPLGPVVGKVGFMRVDSDLSNGDGSKFGIGGDYILSKRTLIYSNVGKQSGNRYNVADKKAKFDLGVTHRF